MQLLKLPARDRKSHQLTVYSARQNPTIANTLQNVKDSFKDVLNDEHMDSPMRAPPVSLVFKKNCEVVPFKAFQPVRTPLHLKESADEYLDDLIKKKIVEKVPIEEPATPWLLQSFFVRRPNSDKARLIINCQPVNKFLERPVTSFTPANEVLSQVLPSSKWFCRFDIKDAYFCIHSCHQVGNL